MFYRRPGEFTKRVNILDHLENLCTRHRGNKSSALEAVVLLPHLGWDEISQLMSRKVCTPPENKSTIKLVVCFKGATI